MAVEAAESPSNALAETSDAFLFRTQVRMSHDTLKSIAKAQYELLEALSA